jgi:hypothetical protein
MSKTATAKITTGQLKLAESANSRVSRFRSAIIKTQYERKRKEIREAARKKFRISQAESRVRAAEATLQKAQHDLEEKKSRMKEAITADLISLSSNEQEEMNTELLRSTQTSLTLLGHSLPADLQDILMLEDTKKMLTVDAVMVEGD